MGGLCGFISLLRLRLNTKNEWKNSGIRILVQDPLRSEYTVYRCDWSLKVRLGRCLLDNFTVNPRSSTWLLRCSAPVWIIWMDCICAVFCGCSGAGQSRRLGGSLVWSPGGHLVSLAYGTVLNRLRSGLYFRTFYVHLDICTGCLAYSDSHDTYTLVRWSSVGDPADLTRWLRCNLSTTSRAMIRVSSKLWRLT